MVSLGIGVSLASEAVQLDPNVGGASTAPQADAAAPVSSYKFVSNPDAAKTRHEELFAFRSAIAAAEPQPAPEPVKAQRPPVTMLLLYGAAGLLILVLAFLLLPSFSGFGAKQKPTVLYMDLGNRRFDEAGLSGRLIVRAEGKPSYELYLDPVDQDHAAGFQAVAENPQRPLVVVVRMLNASGEVACQKEIDFPVAAAGAAPDPTQTFLTKNTAAGDTIRDLPGSDGKIAEITTTGLLPCSLSAYQQIAAWDFAANFPTVQDQADQLKQVNAKNRQTNSRDSRSAAGWRLTPVRFEHLPIAIEGDDVIVGDNPTRGTVDTSSGREFQLGSGVPHSVSSEWQIFPSAIHYRCEKTGVCMLTRLISRTMLQARLVR